MTLNNLNICKCFYERYKVCSIKILFINYDQYIIYLKE